MGSDSETSQAVEQSVIQRCNENLGVNICAADMSVAHRMNKNKKKRRQTDPSPPVTMVRFTSRKARDAVYAARRHLKSNAVPIYINEDLTKLTAELFHEARKLVKQKILNSAWTTAGGAYIRETGEPSCRPRKITSIGELPRVQIA